MSRNTIGTGSLTITANMDSALRGLDMLEKKADRTRAHLNKVDGRGAGGGASFGRTAGAVAAGTGFSGAVDQLAKSFVTWSAESLTGARRFREQLEGAARASEAVAKNLDRALAKRDETLGAIANRGDRLGATNRDIGTTGTELQTVRDKIAGVRGELSELNSGTNWKARAQWVSGVWGDNVAAVTEKLKALEAQEAKLSDRLFNLGDAAAKLRDPSKDPAVIGAANSLTESLREQAATHEHVGRAAQIAAIQYRGATGAMIADAAELAGALDRLDAAKEQTFKPTQLAGAIERGSAEAYSLTTKFQVNAQAEADQAKKQTAALEQIKADIRRLVNKPGGPVIGAI